MKDDARPSDTAVEKSKSKKWYQKSRWIVLFLIVFWPLGVYYMWRYAAWKLPVKIIVSALELLLFIIFLGGMVNTSAYIGLDNSYYSTPKTDDSSFLVSGTAPADSIVEVNNITALRSNDTFRATVPLKEGDNQIIVVVIDGKSQVRKNFIVHRNTSVEIKNRNDAAAAAKKAVDDAAAKAQAQAAAQAKADAAAKAQADAAAAAAAARANAPAEYKSALAQATSYVNTEYMSKQGVYDQLVSQYGGQFSAAAAQYAIDNVTADWNANALAKAKDYQNEQNLSPAAIHDQLTSQYGEQFTESEADYAIQHLND